MRYVALLRGINVGGHTVTMDRLRTIFAGMGFAAVGSYIQSGNVYFTTDRSDREELRRAIEAHLRDALGYEVPTCLRTPDELDAVVALDPFAGIDLTPDRRFSVTFLTGPHRLGPELALPHRTPKGDYELVAMTPTELFVVWHLAGGRPGTGYAALEKQAGVSGTTRFWHTAAKILAAAKKLPQ